MVGIKVAQSTQGENRCFYLIREDGTAEDFSAKKCLDAVELNPPYVKTEAPKEIGKDAELAFSTSVKEVALPEVAKTEQGAASAPAADDATTSADVAP